MSTKQNEETNLNIDFFIFVDLILQKKFFLIFLTILGTLIGAYLDIFRTPKPTYEAKTIVYSLNDNQSTDLDILNRQLDELFNKKNIIGTNIIIKTDKVTTSNNEDYQINESDLFDLYYMKSHLSNSIAAVIEEKLEGTYSYEEIYNLVKSISKSVRGIEGINKIRQLVFTSNLGGDPGKKIIFEQYLFIINSLVVNQIRNNIQNYLNFFNNEKKIRRDELINRNQQLSFAYKSQLESKIINLKEQSQIARSLNLERPPPQFNLSLYGENDFMYLRGFIAIEENIKILNNRLKSPDSMPEIKENLVLLQKLETDLRITTFQEYFSNSTFGQENTFETVYFEPNDIKTTTLYHNKYYFFYASLLSLFVGVVIILFNYSFRMRIKN